MKRNYIILLGRRIWVKDAVQVLVVLLILGLMQSYRTRHQAVKQMPRIVASYALH